MDSANIAVHYISRPGMLPRPPRQGRVVVLDIAFANGDRFLEATRPFIAELGTRLALWVDHHDHPAWPQYCDRPQFLLVSKLQARACPQLIDPAVVARAGHVDHVVAHADFDGCMSAVKFLRGGLPPYPEADEDARYSDAPGQGFTCSARGLRLCKALDQAHSTAREGDYLELLTALTWALVHDREEPALRARLDALAQALDARTAPLEALLLDAEQPHPKVLLLEVSDELSSSDKKFLLRRMEERCRIAVLRQGGWTTAATFDDGADGLDLSAVPGLSGQRGYAWGRGNPQTILRHLVALAER